MQGGLERHELLVQRYERTKDAQGAPNKIQDDLRLAALTAMVPEDIEQHLLMNDARLSTYELARAEVINFLESRHGLRVRDTRVQRDTRAGNDPMDVDSFQHKGKSKGKGKSKDKGKGKGTTTKGSTGSYSGGGAAPPPSSSSSSAKGAGRGIAGHCWHWPGRTPRV